MNTSRDVVSLSIKFLCNHEMPTLIFKPIASQLPELHRNLSYG